MRARQLDNCIKDAEKDMALPPLADRAGALRAEPAAQSQAEPLIPSAEPDDFDPRKFDNLFRYVNDPAYRAEVEAEVAEIRAAVNRMFPSGWEMNQARWAREEADNA